MAARFVAVCPLGQLPLTNLLFPAETATRVGTNNCSTARGELSACRLRGGRCCTRLLLCKFYAGSLFSKVVVPFGTIPLNRLQSLRDRIPHGVNCIHTACDHCFVIASEGVTKKWNRTGSIFLLLPLD